MKIQPGFLRRWSRGVALFVAALLLLGTLPGLVRVSMAAVSVPLRINANGPQYTDSTGQVWSADQAYATGSWGYTTRYGTDSTSHAISGTNDPTLYQTSNLFNANTGYNIDVANGTYNVTLKMVEDWATAANQRVFDVTINGTMVLSKFDIYATCGSFAACDKTFSVSVTNGQISIGFNMDGGSNYGTISAIQVTAGSSSSAPTAPTNLTAGTPTSSSVPLSWGASTSSVGISEYHVYNGSTEVGTTTSTSYTVTGLSPSTSYTFTVKAKDVNGTYSAASNAVTVTTAASSSTPPTAPTNLTVTGTTVTSVSLSWGASTSSVGLAGYDVYNGSTKVGTTTSTSYTVTGLSPNTSYTFTVKARDTSGGVSAASNAVTATTPADTTAPTAPTNLAVSSTTSSSVSLSWTASTDNVGVTGYTVYNGSTSVGTTSSTSYTVTGLAASTSYTFTVKASDAAGNVSAASNAVTGTTQAATSSVITAPTNVTVAATTQKSITLSWTASTSNAGTGNAVAYYVYNGSNIVATSMGTKVTVSSLNPSTSYTFTVVGYDVAGNTSPASVAVTASTAAASAIPYQHVAYYDQWSVYGNAFYPQNVDTTGMAGKLTTIIYDFENIDPTNLTCFEAVQAASSSSADGAGDAYADYQKSFSNSISVDGTSDSWSQPIKGSFNQLRELKAKYPNLRILVSIGGWTYSKYFSDVAMTTASRQKFVSSCINMFLKGNLPTGIGGDSSGGPASGAGIFDGFDIDWEYPGVQGEGWNHVSSSDGANYTLLMQEFRSELDAYGQSIGKKFLLTAAVPAGQDKISQFQISQLPQYMDWIDLMSYDMHGAWETTTNNQAPLHDSPNDPSNPKYNIDTALNAWTSGGMPASKIMLGIPLYARGWTGVPNGGKNGLYQSSTGPSASFSISQTAGIAYWKELVSAGKTSSFYNDSTTQAYWIYDGTNFYTLDPPASISIKTQYIKSKGLGGAMMFSLLDDDPQATLVNAVTSGL